MTAGQPLAHVFDDVASELCGLELRNVDLRNGAVLVFGKGSKERSLPIGPRTKSALSKHILENRAEARVNEPVFLTVTGQPMDRCALLKLVYRLAKVADVRDAHPHRFRHTFAIQYLRNGGNERTLQDVLGHESLDMLRTYTRIAQVDMINGHQLASPVENWRLRPRVAKRVNNMSIEDITWDEIDRANRATGCYQPENCPHCGRPLVRRLPERTLHRHLDEARTGRSPLTNCPGCRQPLRGRNSRRRLRPCCKVRAGKVARCTSCATC